MTVGPRYTAELSAFTQANSVRLLCSANHQGAPPMPPYAICSNVDCRFLFDTHEDEEGRRFQLWPMRCSKCDASMLGACQRCWASIPRVPTAESPRCRYCGADILKQLPRLPRESTCAGENDSMDDKRAQKADPVQRALNFEIGARSATLVKLESKADSKTRATPSVVQPPRPSLPRGDRHRAGTSLRQVRPPLPPAS